MSFYHVFPSNAAPETFPDNHASLFSTPLDKPYNLTGQWEVALMNMSYTGCVNTFNNDVITVAQPVDLKTRILKTQTAVKWKVPRQKTILDMLLTIQREMQGILELTLTAEHKYCRWQMADVELFAILSPSLTACAKLWQDVLTSWDKDVINMDLLRVTEPMPDDVFIIFVPLSAPSTKIELKSDKLTFSATDLVTRFNRTVTLTEMTEDGIAVKALDNYAILFSPSLTKFLNVRQGGIYKKTPLSWPNHAAQGTWFVTLYPLYDVDEDARILTRTITLPPASFRRHKDALAFLNKHLALFSCDKDNMLVLKIPNDAMTVRFSDTLRDIFAFDRNTYSGSGTYKASAVLSLTRRIHYLYIYSNMTDYVRIGDTEAPLLAVIPFSVSNTCDILKEAAFKNPMYIPLRHHHMSQVDIAIHDDAGDIVPFVSDAITSLRLHYRQV